jgi:putative acetyltransferase
MAQLAGSGLGQFLSPRISGTGYGLKADEKRTCRYRKNGAAGCVVHGEPGYYGRFGFRAVDGLFFPGVPAGYFQALSFDGKFPLGEVAYLEAFLAQG